MSRRELVFVLENSFPYYAGGIENWTYNMVKRLRDNYHITIVSENRNFGSERLYYNIPDGIKLIPYFSFRKYKWYSLINHSYFSLLDYKLRKHSIARAINKVLNSLNDKDTVIIALSTMAASYAAGKIKHNHKEIEFVCSSRGPHADVMSKNYPLFRKQILASEISNMRRADIVLTNGYDTQEYYSKRGISSIVMKNGVDLAPFYDSVPESPYKTHNKIILSVGTLWDIKGIPELISAFGIMLRKGVQNVELCFAGKGDPSKYEEQAKRLGVDKYVHFIGHQSNLIPYYKNATVIACLSGGGGFGMAAIEAMASGRPVVAWDSPVYKQFQTTKQTMVLTEEKNVEKLAQSLMEVMSNEDNFSIICNNAKLIASEFDWSKVVDDFIKIIDNQ